MAQCTFVLHGTWLAVDRRDHLLICLPPMQGHLYLAGPWLAETQLPASMEWDFREYLGDQPGRARFSTLKGDAPIVHCGAVEEKQLTPSARLIRLPYPNKIVALTSAEADSGTFLMKTGSGTGSREYKKIGVCFGLQFEVARPELLPQKLEGAQKSSTASNLTDWGVSFPSVFHIYSSSSSRTIEQSAAHQAAEPAMVQAFFPAANLVHSPQRQVSAPAAIPNAAEPLGLTPWETLTLIERQDRMQSVGDAIREGLRSTDPSVITIAKHKFVDGGGQGASVLECSPFEGDG